MRSFPTEYLVLTNTTAAGPVVGYLGGRPIIGRIRDQRGRSYRYTGLAPRRLDGTLNVDLLRPGEWIVEPGLVYLADEVQTDRKAS